MGMTEQEANENALNGLKNADIKIDDEIRYPSIKAIEEIILYRQGGLVLIPSDVFKNQCERLDELEPLQQPLETVAILLHNGKRGHECKNCGNELAVNEFNGMFCNWCGQKLKWRKEDAE